MARINTLSDLIKLYIKPISKKSNYKIHLRVPKDVWFLIMEKYTSKSNKEKDNDRNMMNFIQFHCYL